MDIQSIVQNGYKFLMESTYKSLIKGDTLGPNGEPYTYELLENLRKYFETEEDYHKCKLIVKKREEMFGHNNNYTIVLS